MVKNATAPPITMQIKQSVIFSRHACLVGESLNPHACNTTGGAQKVTMSEQVTHQSQARWPSALADGAAGKDGLAPGASGAGGVMSGG